MPITLLQTKFHLPPVRAGLVPRPRLQERLNQGLAGRLILVSAPAGFGKTTALQAWLAASQVPAAWLALDEGDNDPTRFLAYVLAALQTVAPRAGQAAQVLLQSPQAPPAESILTLLINDVAGQQEMLLALDDYHAITEDAVHRAITFLIDNLPSNLHLAIATRVDPPLPLARLRSRDELVEVRADDLRFTFAEVAAFLEGTAGLHLRPEDVAALEARTEGWIAGLRLAELSLRGRADAGEFIHSFTGSHRHVLDFLVTEVFDRQSEQVQGFLLQTSVLARLCASLCEAVVGWESGSMLEYLERANLFLVPLDEERRWYRYHHLFGELLQTRLRRSHPELVPILHARAAQWCEHNGDIDAAIEHSLAGQDWQRAARLLEEHIRDYMSVGRLNTVLGWTRRLPEEIVAGSPRLCIEQGWALLFATRMQEMEAVLRHAELALAEEPGSLPGPGSPLPGQGRPEVERMRSTLAAMQAYTALSRGDAWQALALARRAAGGLPDARPWERVYIQMMLGYSSRAVGDLEQAATAFAESVRIARAGGNTFTLATSLNQLAYASRLRGRLRLAVDCYREALRCGAASGTTNLPYLSQMQAGLAGVLLEQNQVEEALALARDAVEKTRQWQSGNYIAWANLFLAQVLRAQGDLPAAAKALAVADEARRGAMVLPSVSALVEEGQVRLWLAQGQVAAAERWAGELGWTGEGVPQEAGPFDEAREIRLIALARVQIARGNPRRPPTAARSAVPVPVLPLLRCLEASAQASGRISALIEILTLKAAALWQAGGDSPTPAALECLARALILGQPEGFVRVFVDAGEPIAGLLAELVARGDAPVAGYAAWLLAAYQAGQSSPAGHDQNFVEPLTEREREVLRLVAAGYSNREMADRLYVTEGTIKTHVHNLLAKLGAASRTQAVARARELGLL